MIAITFEAYNPLMQVVHQSSADAQPSARELLIELYHGQSRALIAHVSRLIGYGDLAEDLCQETFLRALQYWSVDAPPVEARAWLYRVATNLAYDELRQRYRQREQTLGDSLIECHSSQAELCQIEDRDLLRYLLDALAPEIVTLLVEQSANACSLRELAQRFGYAEGTIKSRMSRARTHLRAMAEPR